MPRPKVSAPAPVRRAAAEPAEQADGRLARSERSRQQIVDAMLKLIRAGEMNPTAVQVAEAANVSLRTVFRHFEELDGLRMEMSAQMEAEIRPILQEPFKAEDWRGRLGEMLARRARLYEHVMPVKIAAGLKRFESAYLMKDYHRFLAQERAGLMQVLPKSIAGNAVLFAAVEMTMSFQAWRRLRQDQGLGAAEAERVMRFTVEKLIGPR
jgi:AcrR family transcriptional regulator